MNLFQIADLEEYLNLLVKWGENYVRHTLSARVIQATCNHSGSRIGGNTVWTSGIVITGDAS